MYAFDAAVNAARVITVPRLEGFKLDVPAIKKAVEEHKPKIIFLTSPNNPDGRWEGAQGSRGEWHVLRAHKSGFSGNLWFASD